MQETESIDEYILQHIDPESDYLKSLYRDTHVKLLRPRMASGHLQGRMLKMFVEMIQPRQILEIGTYSGYSALCLAEGLPEGGLIVDTIPQIKEVAGFPCALQIESVVGQLVDFVMGYYSERVEMNSRKRLYFYLLFVFR